MRVVMVEDRPTHLVGAKLALLSLRAHCPDLPIVMHVREPPNGFAAWFDRHIGEELRPLPPGLQAGWDVKPELLLHHLEAGEQAVVWFDSDLICAGDWRPALGGAAETALVATEETPMAQHLGGTHRTISWGLEPARALDTTVNSALLRVGPAHAELLAAWRELLRRPEYRDAQARPWNERPIHLVGDQEVLTALLGSSGFAHLPLHLLRQGVEIAQCYGPAGYGPGARARRALARQVPPLIHAMGRKPWEPSTRGGARAFYERRHAALSPYTRAARRHGPDLDEPAPWLGSRRAGPLSINLAEYPLALVDHAVRRARGVLGIARFRVAGPPER